MPDTPREPEAPALTPEELERDTWASWWEAHREIGEQVKAGRPLPSIFVPRERARD